MIGNVSGLKSASPVDEVGLGVVCWPEVPERGSFGTSFGCGRSRRGFGRKLAPPPPALDLEGPEPCRRGALQGEPPRWTSNMELPNADPLRCLRVLGATPRLGGAPRRRSRLHLVGVRHLGPPPDHLEARRDLRRARRGAASDRSRLDLRRVRRATSQRRRSGCEPTAERRGLRQRGRAVVGIPTAGQRSSTETRFAARPRGRTSGIGIEATPMLVGSTPEPRIDRKPASHRDRL